MAGVYDLIEEPWDFSGENDKWLRVGLGNGVTSSQAQGNSSSVNVQVSIGNEGDEANTKARIRQSKALGLMLSSIPLTLQHRYLACVTPSELFRAVFDQAVSQDRYQGMALNLQLVQITQTPMESVYEYFQRGKGLATRLANIQQNVTEGACVAALLHGVSKDFLNEKVFWLAPSRRNLITFKEVLADLEHRESLMKHLKNDHTPSHALAAKGQKAKPNPSKLSKTNVHGHQGGIHAGKGGAQTCLFCNGPHETVTCVAFQQAKHAHTASRQLASGPEPNHRQHQHQRQHQHRSLHQQHPHPRNSAQPAHQHPSQHRARAFATNPTNESASRRNREVLSEAILDLLDFHLHGDE